jgi:hypothetical protein
MTTDQSQTKVKATSRIASLLREIECKSSEYRRITKKMRSNVADIFNLFGDCSECQICDSCEPSSNHHKYEVYDGRYGTSTIYYFDDIEEFEKNHKCKLQLKQNESRWGIPNSDIIFYTAHSNNNDTYHKFIPKIELPFGVEDVNAFRTEDNVYNEVVKSWRLAIDDEHHEMCVRTNYGGDSGEDYDVEDVSNHIIKEMLNKNAILEFFEQAIRVLQTKNEEYGEVESVATKLRGGLERGEEE